MGPRAVCTVLAVVLIVAAVRTGFALPPGSADAQLLTAAAGETAWLPFLEDRQSRARLEARSVLQRFRLVRSIVNVDVPSPQSTVRRYALGIDRRPPFHCRLPVPRAGADDPVPH